MELEQRFADDEACRQYLFGLRWPQGIECSACGGRGVWKGSRNRLLCTSCRRQVCGNLESEAIRRRGRCCTSCVEPWFVPVVSVCGVPSKLMRLIGEHRKKALLGG